MNMRQAAMAATPLPPLDLAAALVETMSPAALAVPVATTMTLAMAALVVVVAALAATMMALGTAAPVVMGLADIEVHRTSLQLLRLLFPLAAAHDSISRLARSLFVHCFSSVLCPSLRHVAW